MGKSGQPTPPPPPSATDISAANVEAAKGLTRLQRAMEFGEELLKDGYVKQDTAIPEGNKPIYSSQTIYTSGPSSLALDSGSSVSIDKNGNVVSKDYKHPLSHRIGDGSSQGGIAEKMNEFWQSQDGKFWAEADENAETQRKFYHEQNPNSDTTNAFTNRKRVGTADYKQKVNQITGYEDPATGEVTQATLYYKIGDDGEREVVKRDEAVDVDFTGYGDIDKAKQRWEYEKETSPEQTQFVLDQMKQFGLGEKLVDEEGNPTEAAEWGFIEAAKKGVEKADPTGFAAREKLAGLASADVDTSGVPQAPQMEMMGRPSPMGVSQAQIDSLRQGLQDNVSKDAQPETPPAGSTAVEGEASPRAVASGKDGTAPAPPPTEGAPEPPTSGGFGEVGTEGAPKPPPDYPISGEEPYYPSEERAERLGAPPLLNETAYTPSYERAGEMEDLRRVGEAPQFAEIDTSGPAMERAGAMNQLKRSQAAPSLERLENIPEQFADPQSMDARRSVMARFSQRLQEGRPEKLMADEARRVARGRAAASGNIFGGGAVIEEATAVQQARDAAERQGLQDLVGFLQSGQTAEDYEGRLAQQNLANRLMGIQQRTGAEQAEFGMGQQVLGQQNTASLQERADELSAMGQRNEAQQQEFQNLQSSLAQINQARQAQLDADTKAAGFDNTAVMTERADELGAMSQRNEAEEAEFQNLLQGLQQQQNARTAGFGMQSQATAQRNQALEADFARKQSTLAQRNQARQQSFNDAMQRTATQQQMKQQQMANLQSFSGLAPVSSQFGSLSGAQQQAGANFNPIQYKPTDAMQLLQGQQNLQGNIFGTQARMFDTQMSNQSGGFGGMLGGVAGSVAGSSGFGAALGERLFKKS